MLKSCKLILLTYFIKLSYTETDNFGALQLTDFKIPPLQMSLECNKVNGEQGWIPVGTDNGKKIGICYQTDLSWKANAAFDWNDAQDFCKSIAVPQNSPRAELPKLIYEDFIKSFLPPKQSKPLARLFEEDRKVLTIPLSAYGDRSSLGTLRFKWIDSQDNYKPVFYNARYFNKWNFTHYNKFGGDNMEAYRGFLRVNLAEAHKSDYKPDIVAYKYYNERTTPTVSHQSSVTRKATKSTATAPATATPMSQEPATTTTPTTTTTSATTTPIPQEPYPDISIVFCVKIIEDTDTCPYKQLHSPFWYNRQFNSTKGLAKYAYVYKLKPIMMSGLLFKSVRSEASLTVEFNNTAVSWFTEKTVVNATIYPFDLVRYDCADHFHTGNTNSQIHSTAVCYSNFTLTNEIRQKFCYPRSGCVLQPCLNNGVCRELGEEELESISRQKNIPKYKLDHFKCLCVVPHFGPRCEYTSCETDNELTGTFWSQSVSISLLYNRSYCIHGVCTGSPQQPCECTSSGGPLCKYDFDDCWKDNCKNGVCVDHRMYSTCICAPGFFGTDCSSKDNKCEKFPCKNGGTCLQTQTGFVCTCQGKWVGKTCEEKPRNTTETFGISLAVSIVVIFFFTGCCMCLTSLRQNDRAYNRVARIEEDIALLFELAQQKYGDDNWSPQEKWVDYIYNDTRVIEEVEAIDALLMQTGRTIAL